MKHELPKLPYEYNVLEPYMDELTVRIHHDKHHQTYVDKFNTALEPFPELQELSVEELLKDLTRIPEKGIIGIRNNGGGVLNHNQFWEILKKDVPITTTMEEIINADFGSFENFKKQFTDAALNRFGSGWAWLVVNNGKLNIVSTPNQDTPLSEGKIPILMIDVWEHSYYLKYQNRRAEYVENFFNIINWEAVEKKYLEALKSTTLSNET
jgi:superoxide dismutase, Fe-Mn family